MASHQSVRLLTFSERRLLKAQWSRNEQCARCFHASIQQRAEKSSRGSDQGTPHNAPKRGSSRHERSAKISNELSMLQKGPPPSGTSKGPGSVTGTYHAPPKAPTSSAGFLETPNDMGGPTRMGENVSAGREGPNAQGVGRPIRYEDGEDAVQDTTRQARGVRSTGQVEEPAEGGASVFSRGDSATTGHHQAWLERSARDDTPWNTKQEQALRTKIGSVPPSGVPIISTSYASKTLLHHSAGASTIAAGNYSGVIRDRISSLSMPTFPQQKPLRHARLNQAAKNFIIDKFVRGTYDPTGSLADNKHKQAALNDVARYTMLNGTFSPRDGERVLRKVQSLLPTAAAAASAPAAKKPTPEKQ